jgi:hypothetical protein
LASKVACTNPELSGRLDGNAALAGFGRLELSGLPAAAIPRAMATAADALAEELFLRLMRWTGLMEPTESECEWVRGWGERVWELTAAPAGERVGGEALVFSWTKMLDKGRRRGCRPLTLVLVIVAEQLRNGSKSRTGFCEGAETGTLRDGVWSLWWSCRGRLKKC